MSSVFKRNSTPITQIQTEISDFSEELKSFCELLDEKLEERKVQKKSNDSEDKFVLLPENLIQL